MSVSVTRAEGVTVLTLNTDPASFCPPLCQILHGLCYNPACCTLSQKLRKVQRSSPSLLGALHIMAGLLIIGLAVVLTVSSGFHWWSLGIFPFWLGPVFILLGILSILSENYPSPCLVVVNVILQLSGICFSIAAVVMFSISVANIDLWELCRGENDYDYDYDRHGRHRTTPSPSPEDKALMEACLEAKRLTVVLLTGVTGVLVVLAALELCVAVGGSVLGVRALRSWSQKSQAADVEEYKALVE